MSQFFCFLSVVKVETIEKTNISVVTINAPPVNKMSMELLNDLTDTLAFLTKQQSRGIILTSSSEKVFSAGLDILELYHPNLERFRTYWRTFQNTWIKFYGSSIPIAGDLNI